MPMAGEAPPPYTAAAVPNHQTTVIYPNTASTTVIHQRSPYPVQGTAIGYPGQVYYGSHPPQHSMYNNLFISI